MPKLKIRRAIENEGPLLSALALSAKGSWGYSKEYLAAYMCALELRAEYIRSQHVYVLSDGEDLVIAFFALAERLGERLLDFFFVDKSLLLRGIGSQMWELMLAQARALGWTDFLIHTDPYAMGFYLGRGAAFVGMRKAEATPVRMLQLPLLRFRLDAPA